MSANRRIGFGKKIRLDWLLLALRLRAKDVCFAEAREELEALIAETNPGKAAIAKIISNVRQIVFEPVSTYRVFAKHGVEIFQREGAPVALPVIWGLCISSYWFFAQTSETIGRLLKLQSEFLATEMVRRMTERSGDRGFVRRVARYNLSSLLDWGFLEYDAKSKRYRKGKSIAVFGPEIFGWLAEGILLASGKNSMPQSQLLGSNLFFPFETKAVAAAKVAYANPRLHIVRQMRNEEMVSVHSD